MMEPRVFTTLFLLLVCFFLSVYCDDNSSDDVKIEVEGEESVDEAVNKNKLLTMPPPDIEWERVKKGKKCKINVTNDHNVAIHFVGKLASDGSIFFDSRENNEKDDWVFFPMGVGESIKGLELGLIGMCKEEIRRIVVEPEMIKNGRYKFHPKDGIVPRDQKLIFEVEMMSISPNYNKGLPNMFKVYDTDKDELLTQDEIAKYLIDEGQFGTGGPLIDKLAKEVIDRDDRNKDDSIHWNEFSGPKHDEL